MARIYDVWCRRVHTFVKVNGRRIWRSKCKETRRIYRCAGATFTDRREPFNKQRLWVTSACGGPASLPPPLPLVPLRALYSARALLSTDARYVTRRGRARARRKRQEDGDAAASPRVLRSAHTWLASCVADRVSPSIHQRTPPSRRLVLAQVATEVPWTQNDDAML